MHSPMHNQTMGEEHLLRFLPKNKNDQYYTQLCAILPNFLDREYTFYKHMPKINQNPHFLNFSCIICTAITILCIVHFVFFTAFYYGKQIMWSVSRSRGLFPMFPTSKGLFPVFPTSKSLFPTSEDSFPEN